MNLLELEIKNDNWILLKIDGIEFLKQFDENMDAVNFRELFLSTKSTGKYLIFTCSCGVADCGGWEAVSVTEKSGVTNWNFEYADKKIDLNFDTSFYNGEINRFKFEIDQLNIELEPKNVTFPE